MKELVEGEYYEKVFRGFRLYAKGVSGGRWVSPRIVRVTVEDEQQAVNFFEDLDTPGASEIDQPEGWEISE